MGGASCNQFTRVLRPGLEICDEKKRIYEKAKANIPKETEGIELVHLKRKIASYLNRNKYKCTEVSCLSESLALLY